MPNPNYNDPYPQPWARNKESAAYDPEGRKLLVGTARERFFTSFFDFSTTDDWEVLETGAGMAISGPLGGAVAGSTPYLNIASGVTANARTVLLSRSTFRAPVELRYQISASQRIVNNAFRIGLVEVDPDTGAIIPSTTYATAPAVLNARNAALAEWSGVTATSGSVLTRTAGSAVDTLAAAYGTGFTTVPTGTTPNWIAATTFGLSVERDRVSARAYGMNVLTNTGAQFVVDRTIPNPTKTYRLAIIVENGAVAPASTTDWRIHLVNMIDATRFDVSPRNAGMTDQAKAFPVIVTNTAAVTATLASTTVTPAVPATPYAVNSAATTNAALVLTGTSGLQALYATNTGAAVAYVKLFNKATAPVPGTDVPVMIVPVPAAVGGVPGRAEITPGFIGYRFALGLGIAITGGAADADTTAVAAGQVKVLLSRTV